MRSGVGLAMLLGMLMVGQFLYPQFPSPRGERNSQHYPDETGPTDQSSNGPEKRRIKMLNAERQKALLSDADKLLKLARELNDEVSRNDSETMTSGQLRKVEEIGKLAKSVKEKMSYSVGGSPSLTVPLTIQPGIQ